MNPTTIGSLPNEILYKIFLMSPEESATIARVCKQWNAVQNAVSESYAAEYLQNPTIQRFMPKQDGLTAFQCVNRAVVRSQHHCHQYPDIDLINHIHGPIEPQFLELAIRQIDLRKTDQNLIVFFERLRTHVDAPELPHDLSIAQKAAFIRDWMNTNQEALNAVTALSLSDCGLTELPPEIGRFRNLRQLLLFQNQLTELPPEIGNLVNLRILWLFQNQLAQLPPEIGHLVNLQQLILFVNQLTQLPPEIGHLENLQQLILFQNQLTADARAIIDSFQQHHPECNIIIDPPLGIVQR